jgi:integrase
MRRFNSGPRLQSRKGPSATEVQHFGACDGCFLGETAAVKYASVFERPRSPRFYVVYWCPRRQKRVQEATPFRRDDPQGRRKALDLANERSKEARADKDTDGTERWESWVDEFLAQRYSGSAKTGARMEYAWSQWRAFLNAEQIHAPRALDYNAVLRFIAWRSSQVKPSSKKVVSRNTALCDTKVMSVIMREAMRRGFATTNHCEKLGIKKDPAKEKPEMTNEEIAKIRAELKSRPEWMRVSFEVAIHQGCRLMETSLPLDRVDLARKTVQFSAKGRGHGEKHVFTTQLHPGLIPLMRELRESGAKVTCTIPQMGAKDWHYFFKEIKLPHLCFHCTRVTAITKMARAGVPVSQAMAFVGHASETIHRIYQRLAASDLDRAVAAISFS